MRRIFSVAILIASAACWSTLAAASEHKHDHKDTHDHGDKTAAPAAKIVDGKQIYGETMPDTGKIVSIGSAIKSFKAKGKPQRISGEITKVCQKEGCWMVIAEGDQFARVMTKHNFVFPVDVRGNATVYGALDKKEMDLAQAKHMAEDAGKDPKTVTSATHEFRIVASSVVIEPVN